MSQSEVSDYEDEELLSPEIANLSAAERQEIEEAWSFILEDSEGRSCIDIATFKAISDACLGRKEYNMSELRRALLTADINSYEFQLFMAKSIARASLPDLEQSCQKAFLRMTLEAPAGMIGLTHLSEIIQMYRIKVLTRRQIATTSQRHAIKAGTFSASGRASPRFGFASTPGSPLVVDCSDERSANVKVKGTTLFHRMSSDDRRHGLSLEKHVNAAASTAVYHESQPASHVPRNNLTSPPHSGSSIVSMCVDETSSLDQHSGSFSPVRSNKSVTGSLLLLQQLKGRPATSHGLSSPPPQPVIAASTSTNSNNLTLLSRSSSFHQVSTVGEGRLLGVLGNLSLQSSPVSTSQLKGRKACPISGRSSQHTRVIRRNCSAFFHPKSEGGIHLQSFSSSSSSALQKSMLNSGITESSNGVAVNGGGVYCSTLLSSTRSFLGGFNNSASIRQVQSGALTADNASQYFQAMGTQRSSYSETSSRLQSNNTARSVIEKSKILVLQVEFTMTKIYASARPSTITKPSITNVKLDQSPTFSVRRSRSTQAASQLSGLFRSTGSSIVVTTADPGNVRQGLISSAGSILQRKSSAAVTRNSHPSSPSSSPNSASSSLKGATSKYIAADYVGVLESAGADELITDAVTENLHTSTANYPHLALPAIAVVDDVDTCDDAGIWDKSAQVGASPCRVAVASRSLGKVGLLTAGHEEHSQLKYMPATDGMLGGGKGAWCDHESDSFYMPFNFGSSGTDPSNPYVGVSIGLTPSPPPQRQLSPAAGAVMPAGSRISMRGGGALASTSSVSPSFSRRMSALSSHSHPSYLALRSRSPSTTPADPLKTIPISRYTQIRP
ncbi:hypothetical protein CEUSTIGMA_g782.t1 [Chlamydomonas eustigma]|uniref:Uncharacterized protein n=1 Tax=Chlamydomonas eustigma TaxID=1157962 RepID=A0A250WR84_9CHLO|nr:hypothetical protein CEUSTIGMA_g782.t1 [Chlamydomonas eustigma]|eukprot:GAX73328.1 hypothetical protein CEUSTIGMA_g782.t1 [Chlamydomonas eustigma]